MHRSMPTGRFRHNRKEPAKDGWSAGSESWASRNTYLPPVMNPFKINLASASVQVYCHIELVQIITKPEAKPNARDLDCD
jgi:hypothetical protein